MNRTLTGSWSDENLKIWVSYWAEMRFILDDLKYSTKLGCNGHLARMRKAGQMTIGKTNPVYKIAVTRQLFTPYVISHTPEN